MANSGKKIVYDTATKRTLVEAVPVENKEFEKGIQKEKPAKKKRARTVKAEGKAHAEVDKPTFPAKGTVNAYGFIHLKNGIAEAFGAPRGQKTPITIDLREGALIVKKA